MNKLPLSTMEILLKTAGAKRVSENSKEYLQKILNDEINKITNKSAKFANHAGRKTIKSEDIILTIDG
jgi:DNA-binding protein